MGKGLAKAVVGRGGSVLLASRNAQKLERAAAEVLACAPGFGVDNEASAAASSSVCSTVVLDATDEASVVAFAKTLVPERWTGLCCTAAESPAPHGALTTLASTATRGLFETKFWTAYHALKHVAPRLADGGAVALVGGVLNRRPGLNCAPLAAVNGALEGLTRAAALDLAPRLRVNCLSPGFCDTERFNAMDTQRKVRHPSYLSIFKRWWWRRRRHPSCFSSFVSLLPLPSFLQFAETMHEFYRAHVLTLTSSPLWLSFSLSRTHMMAFFAGGGTITYRPPCSKTPPLLYLCSAWERQLTWVRLCFTS